MKCNAQGIALIKRWETLQLEAYPDPATGGEPWTIGYGHTGSVKPGDRITEHQADAILSVDMDKAERGVTAVLDGLPVNENEFSALVSFAFNLGPAALARSTLLKKLRKGDRQGAADAFLSWVYAAGKKMRGLERRRAAERELFLSPVQSEAA